MLTDAQLEGRIRALENEIRAEEMTLDRKRIKLELLCELRDDTANEKVANQPIQQANGHHAAPNSYIGMAPTPAITRYLRDHGGLATMSSILDTLSGQIKSESDEPRNIVRNCARQLAKRGIIAIDGGNVRLAKADTAAE